MGLFFSADTDTNDDEDGEEREATDDDIEARVEGAEGLGLGEDAVELGKERDWTVWGEIALAWRRLFRMLRPSEIRRLANTFVFLAAWFLLSDGEHNFSQASMDGD